MGWALALALAAAPAGAVTVPFTEDFASNASGWLNAVSGPLTWNATLIQGNVVEEIGRLKQAPGKSLLQYGVGELTRTMLSAGLVDEIRILVYPFTFGEGPYIFEHMGVNTLKLLESKTFASGTVALHYQPV